MKHIISVLLENEPGALSRVAGLFSARNYNIESLTVAPTNDTTLSRMTIVTSGDDRKIDQIEKHLSKLVDVVALQDITVNRHLEREVILAKVAVENGRAEDFKRIGKVFNMSITDVADGLHLIEMSGSSEKVDELVAALNAFEIVELARSGAIGLTSTDKSLVV
jgi:acetolactate synthase-1/3 small subunit